MHKPNKTFPLPTRRRGLPELGDIESLIDRERALRLELIGLGSIEPIAESARSGAEALTQVGLALEKITELLVNVRNRRRSHHKTTPPAPKELAHLGPIGPAAQEVK